MAFAITRSRAAIYGVTEKLSRPSVALADGLVDLGVNQCEELGLATLPGAETSAPSCLVVACDLIADDLIRLTYVPA